MKTCNKCGETKPLVTGFYRHPTTKDGHFSFCKKCCSENAAKRRVANIEKYRAAEAARRLDKSYPVTQAKYRASNKDKLRARRKLNYAVSSGKIERLPCVVCGSTNQIHGHHRDYTMPFDVLWLCPVHHGEEHRNDK